MFEMGFYLPLKWNFEDFIMFLSKVYKSHHFNLTGALIRFFTGGHHYVRAENSQSLKGLAKPGVPGNTQDSKLNSHETTPPWPFFSGGAEKYGVMHHVSASHHYRWVCLKIKHILTRLSCQTSVFASYKGNNIYYYMASFVSRQDKAMLVITCLWEKFLLKPCK